ncbi:hypothetical protein [Shouchella hunanensis]|uniref:Uncharacterized protein n=1 Tax=Shouchella hunanensis TaxID=766894 RepID=A0ABY7W1W4_9BACI|nr:hypothetical protein [Shouchella hunanensis]WDF02932.1 hypothetical protein PQ477_15710 [Shouchella hunanensis]
MLTINHRAGYATITDDIEIIARIYPYKDSLFVKSVNSGRDYTVNSESEALAVINKERV